MNIRIKKMLLAWLVMVFLLAGCGGSPAGEVPLNQEPPVEQPSGDTIEEESPVEVIAEDEPAIQFVDDMANDIALDAVCQNMIVLYSAHVENLYSLGVGDSIIGVNSTATYPPEAAMLPVYDYNSDPEKVIAAAPDCLVIRPFINRKNPNFVAAVEKAGIPVISLYPESFDVFDDYIMKLGMLSGTVEQARVLLSDFHAELAEIQEITAAIEPKRTAYFESTATNYRTVTVDSMPARAIEYAGGINIASDVEPITEGTTIASYGIEKILMHADDIDVYISQRGAMNAGDNAHSISIREGFENIKAVQNDDILEINQKLISSPTFRYTIGVREVARALYPEVFDEIDSFRSGEPVTRADYASIAVRYMHRQVYVPSSSKYYQQEHSGHVYGLFQDVSWQDEKFNDIETAVLAGYMDGREDESGEVFDPQGTVTREDLAASIFIMGDFEKQDEHIEIADIDECANARIVQILVDNGVFELQDGVFNPGQIMTYNDVIDLLEELGLDG